MKYFLILTLITSCTDPYKLQKANGIYFFSDIQSEISKAKNIEWDVGEKKDKTVSKGIRVSLAVPKITENAKNVLYKEFGIDSWVFRVVHVVKNRPRILGYLYYSFSYISKSTKDVTFNLYYHAASVSDYFRSFKCPAFEHRLYITDFETKSLKSKTKNLYAKYMGNINASVSKVGFRPEVFSTGRTMLGEFRFSLALYNTKKKERYSDWYDIPQTLKISEEEKIALPSCLGVKQENTPNPNSKRFNIQDLEIK